MDHPLLAQNISQCVRETVHLIREKDSGRISISPQPFADEWIGTLPPIYPEWLGDRTFCEVHGTRFAYACGSMANGISSVPLVLAMARAGMLGFLGTAGWLPERAEQAVAQIQRELEGTSLAWGVNLIHSPAEPETEASLVDLYLRMGVKRIEASAFLELSPNVVRYSATGLRLDAEGRIVRPHSVFAKISRPELARLFMEPAPEDILQALVAQGLLTAEEAALARRVPVAEDITVESDSGGHTDNRPLGALFPSVACLRDQIVAKHQYERPIRIGAAGGLGTPVSVAGAFAMGAAYVMTGSVNQASLEAAISVQAKQALAQAGLADVMMAPAADMFETGVKVQVLKRGSLFGQKGAKLYELYRRFDSLEELPALDLAWLEKEVLKDSVESVWTQTSEFFARRNPEELTFAAQNPRHRMALVFRWYLGKSSKWAIDGTDGRRLDFQVWCGPAMGAFNQWVEGSVLQPIENRSVVQIALNLMEGAAVVTRAQQLRTYGVDVPAHAFNFVPRLLGESG